jgi:hypothetical protein
MPRRTPAAKFADPKLKADLTPLDNGTLVYSYYRGALPVIHISRTFPLVERANIAADATGQGGWDRRVGFFQDEIVAEAIWSTVATISIEK